MLLTYKEVPAGGDQKGTPWTIFKTTCVNMSRPWWIVPAGMVAIALAFVLQLPKPVQMAIVGLSLGALIVRTTRVGAFIWLMSGFWLMFMQLFDMLPNFIVDWVDSSAIVTALSLPSWMTDVTPRGTMITQEWMINANSGLIVIFVDLCFLYGIEDAAADVDFVGNDDFCGRTLLRRIYDVRLFVYSWNHAVQRRRDAGQPQDERVSRSDSAGGPESSLYGIRKHSARYRLELRIVDGRRGLR